MCVWNTHGTHADWSLGRNKSASRDHVTDTLRIPTAQHSDQSCKPGVFARGREVERRKRNTCRLRDRETSFCRESGNATVERTEIIHKVFFVELDKKRCISGRIKSIRDRRAKTYCFKSSSNLSRVIPQHRRNPPLHARIRVWLGSTWCFKNVLPVRVKSGDRCSELVDPRDPRDAWNKQALTLLRNRPIFPSMHFILWN